MWTAGAALVILVAVTCGRVESAEKAIEPRTYCESCLATVQELKRKLAAPSRQGADSRLKKALKDVCKESTFEDSELPADKMAQACQFMLDAHEDDFHQVLLSKHQEDKPEVLLCYKHTMACTGQKRPGAQDGEKATFRDSDIEAILEKNKDKVRRIRPVRTIDVMPTKDEL